MDLEASTASTEESVETTPYIASYRGIGRDYIVAREMVKMTLYIKVYRGISRDDL
jgi:hypothetical protein